MLWAPSWRVAVREVVNVLAGSADGDSVDDGSAVGFGENITIGCFPADVFIFSSSKGPSLAVEASWENDGDGGERRQVAFRVVMT